MQAETLGPPGAQLASKSLTNALTHQNLNRTELLPGRTGRACAWCTPFEWQWVICMIRLGWGQGQCWPRRLPGQLWLTRGEAWWFSKARGHLARVELPRRSHAWQVETGKGRVAPKVGRGAAHAFTLVLLTRAKTHEASPDRSGNPEQMPRAALTSGYTCLLRCSASSLERGSALRLSQDSHLSPFLQTGHLLAWTLSKPRPFLFCPQGLKTSIYLQIKGFSSIK